MIVVQAQRFQAVAGSQDMPTALGQGGLQGCQDGILVFHEQDSPGIVDRHGARCLVCGVIDRKSLWHDTAFITALTSTKCETPAEFPQRFSMWQENFVWAKRNCGDKLPRSELFPLGQEPPAWMPCVICASFWFMIGSPACAAAKSVWRCSAGAGRRRRCTR